MGVFRFKRFSVKDDISAMKVGTDGVLLGAVTDVREGDREVLDIGTGTGLVALMLAQRLADVSDEFTVTGIDIDSGASKEANENFDNSPWPSHLRSVNLSLAGFSDSFPDIKFDIIVSNPPFYDSSLKAPDSRRNLARHFSEGEPSLSYKDILAYAECHLSENGLAWLILPAAVEEDVLRSGRELGLWPRKILRIRTVRTKAPSRIIMSFGLGRAEPECDELTLLDDERRRTSRHASLTGEYYLTNLTTH